MKFIEVTQVELIGSVVYNHKKLLNTSHIISISDVSGDFYNAYISIPVGTIKTEETFEELSLLING